MVKILIEKIDKNIQLSNTYEIDVKTGGYKPVTSGGICDFTTSQPKVVVYEPEKMVKKEVKVNVIDGKGRTLMPGLIDVHWHVLFNSVPIPELLSSDFAHLTIVGMKSAEGTLMRGFTTVRDVGGNPFSSKKAIDRGIYPGPRIFPSGPMISPTSGHSDGRPYTAVPTEAPDALSYLERNAVLMRAAGVAQVRLRVREALRMGASQIKISTGGGVSSLYDPLDVTEYSEEEVKAAVEEAENFGTYVAAHTFTDRATQMAINAGVDLDPRVAQLGDRIFARRLTGAQEQRQHEHAPLKTMEAPCDPGKAGPGVSTPVIEKRAWKSPQAAVHGRSLRFVKYLSHAHATRSPESSAGPGIRRPHGASFF